MCTPYSQKVMVGTQVPVTAVWHTDVPKFRLSFTHDIRLKEMRWVLFSNTKRGSIGKLIFTLDKDQSAHIKSISIHSDWRGRGLSKILFLACLSTLSELPITHLELEAEEDINRHGKLVQLYQQWGFLEKTNAKVLFLYNDTECYRKVPMGLSLRTPGMFFPIQPTQKTGEMNWFFMMTLKSIDGTCIVAKEDGMIKAKKTKPTTSTKALWQTLLGSEGEIYLRSMHGKFLCVEEDGNILADRKLNSTWETFQVVPHRGSLSTQDTMDYRQYSSGQAMGIALKDFHGSYLCIDQELGKVVTSNYPVPWDGGDLMELVCNKQDSKPLCVKIMRKHQTLQFATKQLSIYSAFQHAAMTIRDACRALVKLTGGDNTNTSANDSWVMKYMIATANATRYDGLPDWLQLAVFLRGLGLLFLLWSEDDDGSVLRSMSAEEWLVKTDTWVLGQAIPSSIAYPELNELNTDHMKAIAMPSKSKDLEGSGMDNVKMPWTPDEYLYQVLMFNNTSLPTEALYAIRFWSLRCWHQQQDTYSDICTQQDEDIKEWLHSLDPYITSGVIANDLIKEINVEEALPYYMDLAAKYLPESMQW